MDNSIAIDWLALLTDEDKRWWKFEPTRQLIAKASGPEKEKIYCILGLELCQGCDEDLTNMGY